jgi:hypothetical protein
LRIRIKKPLKRLIATSRTNDAKFVYKTIYMYSADVNRSLVGIWKEKGLRIRRVLAWWP